ncbi:hypothetical protein ATEIFO6365_0011037400 [Aspergillus terreus]|uniref:Uncharacterized protein n=1 Tax=Aspergillus terreus TaxID=33178 RepID=A0A5M3YZH5_ASPTE|nr:hypothetical protein ATETN484_0006051600 [Aspergillus terreus]GFF20112.1 hypothetical protein ATEIFO6365_0011037400 [Aspergillus terreus]
MRSNPFLLFDPVILKKAWPLVLSAVVIYGSTIAPSFPPGALTVAQSAQAHVVQDAVVPTFNASDVGNRTYGYLAQKSLANMNNFDDDLISNLIIGNQYAPQSVQYLIRRTLSTRSLWNLPSPCGSNCSYTLHFAGPYLQCTSYERNVTHGWNTEETANSVPAVSFPAYASVFDLNSTSLLANESFLDAETSSRLHIGTVVPNRVLGVKSLRTYVENASSIVAGLPFDGGVNMTVRRYQLNTTEHHLECVPSRADYTVYTMFRNNGANYNVSIDAASVRPLAAALTSLQLNGSLTDTTVMDPSLLPFFRDLNMYTIIQQLANMISCSLNETATGQGDPTAPDDAGFVHYETTNSLVDSTNNQSTLDVLLQYFTRVDLSSDFSTLTRVDRELFTVNQTILNTMLVDITLSLIPFKDSWTTTVNQTRTQWVNVYAFSKPLNFILPYALTLSTGLCVLVLGYYSLYTNGVSAADGGFLQLLTTTRGSATVERAIRGACLGGEENVPATLKNLRMQYGELIPDAEDEKEDMLRTAGFGSPEEVRALNKSHSYGG